MTCILERDTGEGIVELARKSGTACGATPVDRQDAEDSGFESQTPIFVDWSAEILDASLSEATVQMRVVVEDYHGNVRDVTSDTWNVSSGFCD